MRLHAVLYGTLRYKPETETREPFATSASESCSLVQLGRWSWFSSVPSSGSSSNIVSCHLPFQPETDPMLLALLVCFKYRLRESTYSARFTPELEALLALIQHLWAVLCFCGNLKFIIFHWTASITVLQVLQSWLAGLLICFFLCALSWACNRFTFKKIGVRSFLSLQLPISELLLHQFVLLPLKMFIQALRTGGADLTKGTAMFFPWLFDSNRRKLLRAVSRWHTDKLPLCSRKIWRRFCLQLITQQT